MQDLNKPHLSKQRRRSGRDGAGTENGFRRDNRRDDTEPGDDSEPMTVELEGLSDPLEVTQILPRLDTAPSLMRLLDSQPGKAVPATTANLPSAITPNPEPAESRTHLSAENAQKNTVTVAATPAAHTVSNTSAATAPERDPFQTGSTIRGRYVLEDLIGRGGFANIYRARDLRREQAGDSCLHVAIKVLRPQLRERAGATPRLQREFRQTQTLRHPAVVQVFDLDTHDGIWFMVMELLAGETLAARLRKRADATLPSEQAHAVLAACADALDYAHRHHIVHGDFKPSNLLMLNDGGVRVFDFGSWPDFPTSSIDAEAAVNPIATPKYSSPQVLARMAAEPRDDVFSFACVAYEILAGVHPFAQRVASESTEVALPPAPSTALAAHQLALLKQGFAWRREDRPASIPEFCRELFSPANAEPPAAAAQVLASNAKPIDESLDHSIDKSIAEPTEKSPDAANPVLATPSAVAVNTSDTASGDAANPAPQATVPPAPSPSRSLAAELLAASLRAEAIPAFDVRAATPAVKKNAPAAAARQPRLLSVRRVILLIVLMLGAAAYFLMPKLPAPPSAPWQAPAAVTQTDKPAATRATTAAATATPAAATPKEPVFIPRVTAADSAALWRQLANAPLALRGSGPPPMSQAKLPTLSIRAPVVNHTVAAAVTTATPRTRAVAAPTPIAISNISFATARMLVTPRAGMAAIMLQRSNGTLGRARIAWQIKSGTALLGRDFTGQMSGVAEFAENQPTRTLFVPLRNDPNRNSERSFTIELQSAANDVTIAPISVLTITLADPD